MVDLSDTDGGGIPDRIEEFYRHERVRCHG